MLPRRSSFLFAFVVSLASCGALMSACSAEPPGSDPTGTGGSGGAAGMGGAAGTGGAGGLGGASGAGNGSSSSSESSSSSGGGPTKMLGEPCASGGACASGFCVDGVCCNFACGQECHACDLPGKVGSCAPVAVGTDECGEPGALCNAVGSCKCGVTKPPSGGACPAPWKPGASPGTCVQTCGNDECKDAILACPAGFDCTIECSGTNACSGATTLACPEGHNCTVNCSGMNSCMGNQIECAQNGPCTLKCSGSGDACKDATFTCGENVCQASCLTTSKASLVNGASACLFVNNGC